MADQPASVCSKQHISIKAEKSKVRLYFSRLMFSTCANNAQVVRDMGMPLTRAHFANRRNESPPIVGKIFRHSSENT